MHVPVPVLNRNIVYFLVSWATEWNKYDIDTKENASIRSSHPIDEISRRRELANLYAGRPLERQLGGGGGCILYIHVLPATSFFSNQIQMDQYQKESL